MCGMMPLRVSETDPTAVPYGYTGGISPHACAVFFFLREYGYLSVMCVLYRVRVFSLTSYRIRPIRYE